MALVPHTVLQLVHVLVCMQRLFKNTFFISEGICTHCCSPCRGRPGCPACEDHPTAGALLYYNFSLGLVDPALTCRANLTSQNSVGLPGKQQSLLCKELLIWAAAVWDVRMRNPSWLGSGAQLSHMCALHYQGHTSTPIPATKFGIV